MRYLLLVAVFVLLSFSNPDEDYRARYIVETYPLALEIELIYDVPHRLVLTQSAHESNYGRSYGSRTRFNFFGITKLDGEYKVFSSKQESFHYYGKMLNNRRYGDCLDYDEFKILVTCIHGQGYAEDPLYVEKMLRVYKDVNKLIT